MVSTTGIIAELCKHEFLRARRDAHFRRNCVIWFLLVILWCSIAWSLALALETYDIDLTENLPLLMLVDQCIRLVSQKTPEPALHEYSLLPIRRWQIVVAYVARMAFTPATLVWLPSVWHQWWYMAYFVLSGYIYIAWWNAYKHLSARNTGMSCRPMRHANGLLACEMKMRMRIPALRHKMRNGMMGAIMLVTTCLVVREQTYVDFAILYALLFPSLPVMASRLGYEQSYMGLLTTRMHSLMPVYTAKYVAALILLVPCTAVLSMMAYAGLFPLWRMAAWTAATALVIYPSLLLMAPKSKTDSPSSQIITMAALILPPLAVKIYSYLI